MALDKGQVLMDELKESAVSTPPNDTGVEPEWGKDAKKQTEPEKRPVESGPFYTSLRFKLISIISALMIISLVSMIFLATYFFKRDNEIRVQENNLKISDVIALKVKTDLLTIIDKSRLITDAMLGSTGKGEIKYSKLFLSNDRDFIFLGIAERKNNGTSLNFIKSTYNNPLLNIINIPKGDINRISKEQINQFSKSFYGENIIRNLSREFRHPAVGMSFPIRKDENGMSDLILICYIMLDKCLEAFKTTGVVRIFMVNDQGDIIAHPDSSILMSRGNYINLDIVKMMIKSTLNNGQTRYEDENGIVNLGSFKKIGFFGCGVIATVEEERALEEVYNIQRRNIYIMIIGLTIVIMIIYFFAKTITTPIISLVQAANKIRKGNYHIDIKPATRDEIGTLTNSFIEMGVGLEEREKIKIAFGKFVNPDLAEIVIKDDVRLGGERKNVAVLFTDIRSFTAISEKLEPEEVVEFLNQYMTRMVECVDKMNGVVDKFIGDAIMAVWGVPFSRGNDTENAIDAALLMRKSLIEFNMDRGDIKNPIIKVGTGINSGPVLAGQIGSENRMEYTTIGNTVNLASRIEALTKPFGSDILISEDSYNRVKGVFDVERMEPILVKGKENMQQIFTVLGRMDDPDRPRSLKELRTILEIQTQKYYRRNEDIRKI